jgi:transposase
MSDRMVPPRRMRHSFEARCRVVALFLEGISPAQAALRCGVSRATAYRLVARYHEGGWSALCDRPPIARSHPRKLSPEAEAQIVELRRSRGWSARTIGAALGRPSATVHRVLRRHGLSRRERQPRPPANRYEYETVGAMVHLDTKQLGRFWQPGKRVTHNNRTDNRGAGWHHVHVAVDDHSRHATTQVRATDGKRDCVAFLDDVVFDYTQAGIRIMRILTDNGSGYRSRDFAKACARHGIRHQRTRPYTPAPTHPAPTAKPKHSSASCCASGPTHSSTRPASTGCAHSPAGPAGTTHTDPTAHSEATHPSPASHRHRPSTASRRALLERAGARPGARRG